MMAARKLRLAVIGLGIGRWHAENYGQVTGAELVALCDVNKVTLRSAADDYGIKKTFTDYRELCADDDIDAVSVCVPNNLHAAIATCALKHGKHVLCEKPLADTVANAEAIAKAAKKSGRVAMVAMKFRFGGEATYVRKQLDAGAFGDVYYGCNTYVRPLGGIPGMGGWFTKKRQSGGGALIDNGVHLLDLNWYLMGCPAPKSAMGATYAKFGPRGLGSAGWSRGPDPTAFDVEDFGAGMIRFKDGSSIVMDNGWAACVESGTIGVRVLGDKGGATLFPLTVTLEKNGACSDATPKTKKLPEKSQFQHFVDCIRRDVPCISPVEQGVAMVKMLDALYRSAKSGESVKI